MPAKDILQVQLAIEKSVDRLIPIANGDFERSTGRPVFKVITDGLLINIQQAEAQSRPLSKLAQKRLMLWVVVDSLRSPLILNGAAADRAGGRIWKHTGGVSASYRTNISIYA